MKRVRLKNNKSQKIGNYFENIRSKGTFSSGCTVLDCLLGGGYVFGRVYNLVGDKSSGKTGGAVEAAANCHLEYPEAEIRYAEAESAFDKEYGAAMGMPIDHVQFPEDEGIRIKTVESFVKDINKFLDGVDPKHGGLYIIDSLDGLKTKAALKLAAENRKKGDNEDNKGSYGVDKAKILSDEFPELVDRLAEKNVCLLVVSQLRDKIGVTFGDRQTRAGGRALDFYSSVVVWLAQLSKIIKTKESTIKRKIGVNVIANNKKNKLGLPYREVKYPYLFAFGIDDLTASIDFLKDNKRLSFIGETPKSLKQYRKRVSRMNKEEYTAERKRLREATMKAWMDVEKMFLPKFSKY